MDTSWEILSVLGGFLFRVWHEGGKKERKGGAQDQSFDFYSHFRFYSVPF